MRSIAVVVAALGMLLGLAASAGAAADNIAKVACSTTDGDVIGADATTTGGLLGGDCAPGTFCVVCLRALLDDGCKYTEKLKPVVIQVPPVNDWAVVYHFRGHKCARSFVD